RAEPSACSRSSIEPSVEPLSTARIPSLVCVCAPRACRHSRSHGRPFRTTSTTSTLGVRTWSNDSVRSNVEVTMGCACAPRSLARAAPEAAEGGPPGPPSEAFPPFGRLLLLRGGPLLCRGLACGGPLLGDGPLLCRRLLRGGPLLCGGLLRSGPLLCRRLLRRALLGGRLLRGGPLLGRRLLRGGLLLRGRPLLRGRHRSPPFHTSGRHAFQASPFPFAHPTPHAVPLISAEGVVEALDAHGAVRADPLRLPR